MMWFSKKCLYSSNYSNPAIPDVKGSNIFRGKIMHSHSYRDADSFKGNSVLVIGCGASGLDISFGASKVADKVIILLVLISYLSV